MRLRSLLTAGAWITAGMLVGRALGLLRETLLAARFGLGTQADQAIALLLIPDFITAALIGSAASATLVPAFTTRGPQRAHALFWQALGSAALCFVIITLISAMLLPLPLALALASLPLSAATGILTAWLQYHRRFLAPAFANAVFNGVVVTGLWLVPDSLTGLGITIIAAAGLRLVTHIIAFLRADGKRPARHTRELDLALLKAYAATTGTTLFGMLPPYIIYGVIALSGGSVATFNYAFKLILLPAALIQTVTQIVLLPWFSEIMRGGGEDALRPTIRTALRIEWIASFCACLVLTLSAPQITALCFHYGKMTDSGLAAIAHLFSLGVWVVPGIVLTVLWQQILYACHRRRAAFVAGAMQSVLVGPLCALGYALDETGGALVAYAIVQALPLIMLARDGRYLTGRLRPAPEYIISTLAAVLAFAPFAAWFLWWNPSPLPSLAAAACIGVVSLGAGLAGFPEVRRWAGRHLHDYRHHSHHQ